jgi:hypothetical protein
MAPRGVLAQLTNLSAGDTNARIGYVISRSGVPFPWLTDRKYRGIDRLPHVPNLNEGQSQRYVEIWERYLDAQDDGLIGYDLNLAREIQRELEELGNHIDVVYADAIIIPDADSLHLPEKVARQREKSLTWLRSHSERVGAPPAKFGLLGLDVSSPIPSFHSALIQPGLISQDSELASELNEAGLVSELKLATELMHEANATGYGLCMFSVIRVFAEQRYRLQSAADRTTTQSHQKPALRHALPRPLRAIPRPSPPPLFAAAAALRIAAREREGIERASESGDSDIRVAARRELSTAHKT